VNPLITRLLTLVAVLTIVAAACGDDDASVDTSAAVAATGATTAAPTTTAPPPPPGTSGPPVDYHGFRTQPTACEAAAPREIRPMAFAAPEDQMLDPAEPVTAVLETSCGNIVMRLDPEAAPETVNSFVFLAREGYFDGTVSHRIVPGFVLQAGDPTATGTGGPGYVVADEYPGEGFVYARGVLAMANGGPGTTGSQFFIMLGDRSLPPSFSAFGEVVDGFDVLDRIAAIPLGDRRLGFDIETSVPLETLYLERVTVQGE
jgi:cyclophilin family peptidyl-prolyl cis-trans isomerase